MHYCRVLGITGSLLILFPFLGLNFGGAIWIWLLAAWLVSGPLVLLDSYLAFSADHPETDPALSAGRLPKGS